VLETVMLLVSTVLTFGIVIFLVYALIRSIQSERRRSGLKRVLPNFSLGIILCVLFFVSWFAQGLSEWQSFVSEQRAHGEAVTIKGFVTEFSQSTLENWQSEFLQLFSFVVLAALYLHRGSAESRDTEDRIESKLDELKREVEKLQSR
jgi:amino acid transporter